MVDIEECLTVAKLIEDKQNREKVIARLEYLYSKLERGESVDLNQEARNYAQENGLTTPTPSVESRLTR
jgi:hypothetical protein